MLLAQAVLPGRFMVATVDHGLRADSATEAQGVGEQCAALGIPHEILALHLPSGTALQERAREARYAALGRWSTDNDLAAVVTAHHADDQAETLMMRLSRGAGVRGLAGMRDRAPLPGWPAHVLLRPLLHWRRSELAAVVTSAGLVPAIDPSNFDARFERARIRSSLGDLPEFDPLAVAASARHLAEADAAIEWAAERSIESARIGTDTIVWHPADVPRVIVMRVLERVVARLSGRMTRGNAIARWHDRLAAGEIATLAGIRGDGRKSEWRFSIVAPPRKLPDSSKGRP